MVDENVGLTKRLGWRNGRLTKKRLTKVRLTKRSV